MMQGILVRMNERSRHLFVTLIAISVVNAYAVSQLLMAM